MVYVLLVGLHCHCGSSGFGYGYVWDVWAIHIDIRSDNICCWHFPYFEILDFRYLDMVYDKETERPQAADLSRRHRLRSLRSVRHLVH
jgi:hypothetical protein